MNTVFHTVTELYARLEETRLSPAAYALGREAFLQDRSEAEIRHEFGRRIAVSGEALRKGLAEPQISLSGLTRGAAKQAAEAGYRLVRDDFYNRAVAYSLAISEVNACGGKIIAFPTAGSCGIVPGVLWAYRDSRGTDVSEERFLEAFVIASLIGILVAQRATLAGSEGGCQAECGVAGAMAAAGLVHLAGASFERGINAAALSLKNSLGLACDPVAGLVEVPCVKRNAFLAVQAVTAAHLSLAGVDSTIPFDEVVGALREIGNLLPPSLKESSEGGLAVTPTGKKYKEKIR